ncbi:hypothetical protein [Mesorhizobium sp. M0129]|uniref:hypothetical protein n=1 Tax=Mesorhizobium sp. M0129 TaxID=2956886 RepID=UPI0033393C1B
MKELDDITIDLSHLASLLDVLADMTSNGPVITPVQLQQVNALAAFAKNAAERSAKELEQYHRNQIEAAKLAA